MGVANKRGICLLHRGKATSVGLVEDDPMTLKQFSNMIDASDELTLQFATPSFHAALDALSNAPDVLVSDINLPDGSGLDLIRHCKRTHPSTEIIVISVLGDAASVVTAIEAGATGYLLKDAYEIEIVKAVKELISGGSPISSTIARHVLRRFQGQPEVQQENEEKHLSTRESEVLQHIAMGYSYKDIARKMGISPNTVPTYIKSIYRKLEVNSRGEAVYAAVRHGLLDIKQDG